jgi:DNA repair ATPase RecN
MALQRVVIQNFQSLKKVDIELGKFTVIVGASSSGKSAFMRAMRALASGIRGNSFITVGAKSASVSAHTENNIVTLEKSKTKARYLVTDKITSTEEVFTKLATSVPEDVSKALKLQPIVKDQASINFAGQHDMPYLLTDSAAQVAKVLGDLTNVSTIFEAVRQANKKKGTTATLLRTRQADLDALLDQARSFSGVGARRKTVEGVEKALETLESFERKRARLELLTASMENSEAVRDSYVELTELPDLGRIEELHTNYVTFKSVVVAWATNFKKVEELSRKYEEASISEQQAHTMLHEKLIQLGTCPTCGSTITEESVIHA